MIRRTRFVAAKPEDAFALLRDFSRLGEYNPFVRVAQARRGPCEPGDKFELVLGRRPPFRLRVLGEIQAVEDRRIELVLRSVLDARETRFVEEAEGGCVVGWEVDYRVPWRMGGPLGDRVLFRQIVRVNVELELRGVQRILEGGA